MPVPVAITELNGKLKSGNKALLSDVLTKNVECPMEITLEGTSCLIIDGQARVVSLGKPKDCNTFGEYADHFVRSVLMSGQGFDRIDVTFDRYKPDSIKGATREKRSRGLRPIRRVIEGRSVPLPTNWQNFLADAENKADLACFLSAQLLLQAPIDKTLVVAGGFEEANMVKSSNPNVDLTQLSAHHEEADTRMILHSLHVHTDSIVVAARDTDVLVLLIAHFGQIPSTKLWMKAGTAKKPKYIPVHEVYQSLSGQIPDLTTLIAFHSLTGCDTVSHFAGHSKKTAWKTFLNDTNLLANLGKGELSDQTRVSTEKFICKLYNFHNEDSCDKARAVLFTRCKAPESLPPTSDALKFHIERAHYQSMVWRQASRGTPVLPEPQNCGWTKDDNGILNQN